MVPRVSHKYYRSFLDVLNFNDVRRHETFWHIKMAKISYKLNRQSTSRATLFYLAPYESGSLIINLYVCSVLRRPYTVASITPPSTHYYGYGLVESCGNNKKKKVRKNPHVPLMYVFVYRRIRRRRDLQRRVRDNKLLRQEWNYWLNPFIYLPNLKIFRHWNILM